ncbi:isopenicillin N synthase family dioxygenase [Micromonospora sp. NPDC051925]|uniref:isopenicillin N synthase family dioxygenase n=1 Tax=Micromonospora sp. NPDC051925 TaxID=3364288 RepID=UPI0037C6CC05
MTIPTVHIGALAAHDPEAVAAVRQATRQIGLFYLDLRPEIGAETFEDLFVETRRFFHAPDEVKSAISVRHSPHYRGFVAPREESTNGTEDLKESWEFGREAIPPADAEPQDWFVMYGGNQWPDPTHLPGFRPAVDRYTGWVSQVGRTVVQALARSMGQHDVLGKPDSAFGEDLHWFSRLIYYRDSDEYRGEDVRLGEHTDSGMLTVSIQDSDGLEVRTQDGEWLLVSPPPGACVVFTGELMGLWSGGYYPACRHRVHTDNLRGDRVSVITFFIPELGSVLRPIDPTQAAAAEGTDVVVAVAADNPWLRPGEKGDAVEPFVVGEREWARVHEIFPRSADEQEVAK